VLTHNKGANTISVVAAPAWPGSDASGPYARLGEALPRSLEEVSLVGGEQAALAPHVCALLGSPGSKLKSLRGSRARAAPRARAPAPFAPQSAPLLYERRRPR
jgi:hypothetical protein